MFEMYGALNNKNNSTGDKNTCKECAAGLLVRFGLQ